MKDYISNQQDFSTSDSFTLRQLLEQLWLGKWIIIVVCALASVASVFYALNEKDIYKAEVLLAPVSENNGAGVGGLISGQLGGLASLANINLGSNTTVNKTQLAMQIISSRKFVSEFVEKYKILPDLIAANGWDRTSDQVTYDSEAYDTANERWIRQVPFPLTQIPSHQEAHRAFLRIFNVNQDKETGLISISVRHYSPTIAKRWVDKLVVEINEVMRKADILEAEKSISFLEKELNKTKVADFKNAFHSLIEEQTKTIMFAKVRDEYVFKTVDPALAPEQKDGPNRAFICVLGFMAGLLFGVFIVVARFFSRLKD
ncbi:hypothetical protein PRUB_a2939 [Pseudoalteromonas rubra]|uniref:Polysaccharide chain length determinant N-terminal domain-containing protein n=1 Tax=Pseudoalteromonas rubra TaxID=43658 RepID=A0A8T0CE09_9GAMM|nr:Wzz/FepE/Etk N-terminal domain-containing protein [Pseudoalteromonas rubra]KAF7788312.1 hypothetical protein PRUB_a2939 [Pseudoalteromonas rubra]